LGAEEEVRGVEHVDVHVHCVGVRDGEWEGEVKGAVAVFAFEGVV
jgi:hypothetical protein